MKRISIFSFGYWGWGNATKQLVEAVDTVERLGGFKPPKFLDIRIHRDVRATGFNNRNFEDLLGSDRYQWMQDLGNTEIMHPTGLDFKIRRPGAAEELLDEAIRAAKENRRVIFFCGCEWPKLYGKTSCHRTPVASLLLRAAKKRKQSVEIIEWPGDKPKSLQFHVSPQTLRAVEKGRNSIPLLKSVPAPLYAGLPLYWVAKIVADDQKIFCAVGPARFKKGEWYVPIIARADGAARVTDLKKASEAERKSFGLASQLS